MKKLELIFNDMCFPCRPKKRRYDVLHIVPFYEDLSQLFKNYDAWSKFKVDLKFGSYLFYEESDDWFTEPIHGKSYQGSPFYAGNGLEHLYFDGFETILESRAANHYKNESDGIYKRCVKYPDKYKILVLDHNIPKQVAEAEEAVLISWMYDILGLKYDNSGMKIKKGTTLNKRRENLESVQFYLNIPENNYVSK